MNKPREFWIDARPHSAHIGRVDTQRHTAWGRKKVSSWRETIIHVIEKSAADKLADALSISRGQWIHSVNKEQCLKALAEYRGDQP